MPLFWLPSVPAFLWNVCLLLGVFLSMPLKQLSPGMQSTLVSTVVDAIPASQGQLMAAGSLAYSQALGFHASEVWRAGSGGGSNSPRWMCLSSNRFASSARAGRASGMVEEKEKEEHGEEDPVMPPQHSSASSPGFPCLSRQVCRSCLEDRGGGGPSLLWC